MKLELEITLTEKNGKQWIDVLDTSHCPQTNASRYLFPDVERFQTWLTRQAANKVQAEAIKLDCEQAKRKVA